MSVITTVPEPNIWDVICKDFASKRPPFVEEDAASIKTEQEDYDPAKAHPALYGLMHARVPVDTNPEEKFDPAVSHPACVGYAFVDRPPASPPPEPAAPPNKDTCSPREYLEHYVFPVLLPALERMLEQAKVEKCFERKRTKFNALDFLTEYLYKHNPQQEQRENVDLWDIPFVKEWLKDHPRPPLPLSLIWTEEEATQVIQNFWRGHKVRCDPEIQELRQWQKEWREENENINNKVSDFWAKQMPDGDQPTPNASQEVISGENQEIMVKSPAPGNLKTSTCSSEPAASKPSTPASEAREKTPQTATTTTDKQGN